MINPRLFLSTLPLQRGVRIATSRICLTTLLKRQFNSGSAVVDPEKLLSRKPRYTQPLDTTPLKEAPSIYATVHINDRKFLVTEGDVITIPVKMRELKIGDELILNEVSEIGSRDYTVKGGPMVDRSLFTITARVIEKTKEARRVLERTKPRRRHVRHVVVKNDLTLLRINEIRLT